MTRPGAQNKLFDTAKHLPNGFIYRPEFITESEERKLLDTILKLPLEHARFKEYTSKRLLIGFGWGYDYEKKVLVPGDPLPKFLELTARKIAKWLDIPRARVVEALINEYPPGTQIGWHRDSESFEHIVGISLNGWCRLRLRPIKGMKTVKPTVVDLEARSAYLMQGASRWDWQHSIAPTKTHRFSITFRTLPRR